MDFSRVVSEIVQSFGGVNKTSRRADIPTTTLHYIITGETKDPRVSTLEKLATLQNRPLSDLIRDAEKRARV